MSKENKSLNKKPRLNPYWIYGVIITIFLGMQIFYGGFGSQNAATITPSKFIEYLGNGDVSKIEIVNKREAKVYLTKEAIEKEVHKATKPNNLVPAMSATPNYTFEFGDLQNFEKAFISQG